MNPTEIIAALDLVPHAEGGHYRETWRHQNGQERGSGTAIYYLLQAGERSHWHRIDAAEVWHFYAGSPLELLTHVEGAELRRQVLGADIAAGELPQIIVPANRWQAASSLGDWTLVGCTMSPAFEFGRFELAAEGWSPEPR